MFPRIFQTIAADAVVTAMIGTNPVRFYLHGSAPQKVAAPYCTWYIVAGTPENNLSTAPATDRWTIQVDCWSDNAGTGSADVETLAEAVRDALEPIGHMTAVVVNTRDPETMRFRIGLQFDIWLNRPETSSSA
jgi:hypothetical protein